MKSKLAAHFWTWFCLIAVLLMVNYAPVLFFKREYYAADHTFYFEPFARLIADAYRHGHLPLWNPYSYCGMSQLANPSPGIFYAPDFLFVFMPYSQAMGWIQVIQQLVAFIGGFLLVESLGWGLAAAAFCGALMALNGYMMTLSANYSLPGTFCWGVLALYALINIARPSYARCSIKAGRAGFTVLAALSVHQMILAGRPEIFVPMMALLGTTAGFTMLGWLKPFTSSEKLSWQPRMVLFAWQIGAMILGILLSAYILLPVYEWSKLSPRAGGIALHHVFNWSTNWYDLLCIVCPQPLGDLQQPTSHFLKLVASRDGHYPFLPSALIGPVAFSLFLLGLGDRTFKERFYLLGGFAISLVLAIGKYGPVSTFVLKAIPFLSILRYPCKLLIVVIFFAIVLGARGLHLVAEDKVRPWQNKSLISLWLVLIAVATFFTLGGKYATGHITTMPADLLHDLGLSGLVTSLIGLFVAALICYASKYQLASRHVALLLVLLTTASVFAPALKNMPKTVAEGFYSRSSAVENRLVQLQPDFHNSLSGRFCPLYFDPLKVASGYAPRSPIQVGEPFMQYTRELCLPNTNSDNNVRETFGYEASEGGDYRADFLKALHASVVDKKDGTDIELARFCAISSTKYVGTQIHNDKGEVKELNSSYFALMHNDVAMNYRIYEVLSTKPRAWFAPAYRTVAKQADVEKALFAPATEDKAGHTSEFDQNVLIELDTFTDVTADKLNLNDYSASRATTILNSTTATELKFAKEPVIGIAEDDRGAAQAKTAISFLRDSAENISLSVNVPAAGFFVLNDRYYPGWHAVVDTMPVRIYRANGFMRAVYLDKGAHLVDFNYEPESLRNGFYIAALAAMILLALLLICIATPVKITLAYLSTGKWPEAS